MATGQQTITFTAKDILQGLSPLQDGISKTGGFFSVCTNIDLNRYPGMICPGPLASAYSGTPISEALYTIKYLDSTVNYTGLVLGASHLYKVFGAVINTGGFPHAYTAGGASKAHSILTCSTGSGGTPGVFYFLDGDIGKYVGSSLTDNWGSTIPSGAAIINSTYIHRALVGTEAGLGGMMYFTNGGYVGAYDPTTGTNGTLNVSAFSLPAGFIAYDILPSNGYIEIYASNGWKAIIIQWDGVPGDLASSIIDVDEANILGGKLVDGFPHLVTQGNTGNTTIRQKNFYGYPQVQTISNFTGSTVATTAAMLGSSNGSLYIGDGNKNTIFTYGTPFSTYSYRGTENSGTFQAILQQPFSASGTVQSLDVWEGGIHVVSNLGTGNSTIEQFSLVNNTTFNNSGASFRTLFFDLPINSTIESIKFYIQYPSASTAAFTPSIYTDYKTSAASWTAPDDVKAGNLDVNGNAKTYFGLGLMSDNFAISGVWSNSTSNTGTIVIHRIDVTIAAKQ